MKNKTVVADLRKRRGWTQERLAEETGLSVRTIQRIEKGEDSSLETLGLVADAFKIEINELFIEIEDSEKLRQVTEYTEEQNDQLNKRRAEGKLFSIIRMMYFFAMIILAWGTSLIKEENEQVILGIIWLFVFILGNIILSYIRLSVWNERLDKKYPLTKNLQFFKAKETKEHSKSVVSIFWSTVIPLLFILKYALHLF